MGSKPRVLILTGYGLNCEAESSYAWERAGADAEQVHLHDVLERPSQLHAFDALMFIGGFSYGDHMGSGHVFAARVRHHLREDLQRFIDDEKLVLGICNGFQVMVRLGLLPAPGGDYFSPGCALIQNDCGTFQNFWVDLRFEPGSPCVFTKGLDRMHLPIRHGEGRVYTGDRTLLEKLENQQCVACRYLDPGTNQPATSFPHNPNGSVNAIAGLSDPSGRVFGMMPHPEAYSSADNHPLWDRETHKGERDGEGLKIFRNAVSYLA